MTTHKHFLISAQFLLPSEKKKKERMNHNEFNNAIVDKHLIGRLLLESGEWLLLCIPRKN